MSNKSGRKPTGPAPTQPPQKPQQQMFNNLLSSKPKKERGGPMAVATLAVIHAVLITLAVWATSQVKAEIQENDTLAQIIQPDEPEPPPPPPPPPPPENEPPPVQQEVVDVPKGFQTLAPPTIVPPDIPPPSTGPVINEKDFIG